MQSVKISEKMKVEILTNATHLKLGDLKISDRAKIDASMSPIDRVQALYVSESIEKKVNQCKHYNSMPYKPLPNSIMYGIIKSTYN
jgi:hypothetical protein